MNNRQQLIKYSMNKLVPFSCMLLAVSCGPSSENVSLDALKSKRDSLKGVYKEVGTQLAAVEGEIAELDPNIGIKEKIVKSATLDIQPFEHYFEVQGVVESDLNATLTPEVPGLVNRIYVKTGDRVQKGQTLASIDTDVIQKNIKELQNGLDLATTVFDKQKRLWDQKIGSEIQYLQAKNNKESLELKLSTLKTQLKKSSLVAPFSGIVDDILTKEGQMANPGFPVMRLVNLKNLYVKSEISEDHITDVKKGSAVIVAFPSQKITQASKISRVGSYIDPNNRTFLVEVDINNNKGILKPNLISTVKIQDYRKDSAIAIPSSVIQQDALQQNFVYVVSKDMVGEKQVTTAKKVIVETGLSYQGKTEVLSGLSKGDILVTDGARSLSDTERIKIAG